MAINPNKSKKLPGGILLFILCILSIVLMTAWIQEGNTGVLHKVRSGVEVVTTPIKSFGTALGTPFRAVGDFIGGVTTSSQTAKTLRAQNEELRSQIIRTEEYRQENERLSSLLDMKDAYQLQSVGARVIGTGTDPWNKIITINKGSNSGFSVGMPVMNANGLIGQIETVSQNSATVRLISDEKSGVSAFIQSNRAEGILSGSVDGILYLELIRTDIEVAIGDKVITSGSGGIFPKGIPIGEVISVKQSPADVYKTIVIAAITKVDTYEEILVLTGTEADALPSQNSSNGLIADINTNTNTQPSNGGQSQ